MTDRFSDAHHDLQRQLDAAGRHWQPRHPGWDTLLDRLPPQEPAGSPKSDLAGRPHRSWPAWQWMAAAVALAAAIVILTLMLGPGQRLEARMLPVQVVRGAVQVTIFNAASNSEPLLYSPLQQPVASGKEPAGSTARGLMLVTDRRQVLHLRRGDNVVRFTDVAASIDPTSVRLVSDTDPSGTKVVDQNFEFDLANADGILQRSLNQRVTCISRVDQERTQGFLLSFDDRQLVLSDRPLATSQPAGEDGADSAARPRTQTLQRASLQAISVEQIPRDLQTRPALVWTLRSDKPGDHAMTLTYLCGNAVWHANYVVVLSDLDTPHPRLDLKGWVTIDNRSGATYENARLKLIAGDVNRVRDPWASQRLEGLSRSAYRVGKPVYLFDTDFFQPEFVQQNLFEYKLYALSRPSTINDRQIKQLQLLKAKDVTARRRYLCRATPGQGLHPEVRLQIENLESNHLGIPLPKGMIAMMAADPDGELQLVNRYTMEQTAKDEKVNISMGSAFDAVYDYRIAETRRPSQRQLIQTYEFVVRNHKRQPIDVRLVGRLDERPQVTVTQSSDPYTQYNAHTLHFDFVLPPDSEKRVVYTVSYRW